MKSPSNSMFRSPMLTDGGLETCLIYMHGIELPHFATFPLLEKKETIDIVFDYYRDYLEIADKFNTGFILESATWRANPDWGLKLGYNALALDQINRLAIDQLKILKEEYSGKINRLLISGCIGPRKDGYHIENMMSVDEAREYHSIQIKSFKEASVDMVSGLTINYSNEALGIVKAGMDQDVPVVISFTLETDGRLPSGEGLEETIKLIDLHSEAYPKYYMINCAHPSHFAEQLKGSGQWKNRIMGLRVNASCKSHQELDESIDLDSGDIVELANWHETLKSCLPNLNVYGGCCGTDSKHIEAICSKIV